MLAHVMLPWFTKSWIRHPRQALRAPTAALRAPTASLGVSVFYVKTPRLTAVTTSTSLTLRGPPQLCTAHRQMPETEFLSRLMKSQASPEISSCRVWNRSEIPPGSCSKLLGFRGGEEGGRTTFNSVSMNLTG